MRERSQSNSRNEEIFDAEASVFRGPADINNFYGNEVRRLYTSLPNSLSFNNISFNFFHQQGEGTSEQFR